MTRVPFVDLREQSLDLSKDLVSAFERVLNSGRFVLGNEVAEFERRAAEQIGVRHAVGVSSGTDALVSALAALGIGPGDEVITTPLSFIATAEAVLRIGATLRFVDVDPSTLTMDPALVEAGLTNRTRAVIPVHLYGWPARMDALSDLAAQRGFFLIEDAAQAYGSRLKGRSAGAWGHVGCFSFFPTKILGAIGDAGLVVTDDDVLSRQLKRLRQHGSDGEGVYGVLGGNFRIDAVQAAVLSVKMPHVERWMSLRRDHACAYDAAFRNLPELELFSRSDEVFWNGMIYTLRVREGRRDALRRYLAEHGIETRVYYDPPLHMQPALSGAVPGWGALPKSERAALEVLSLPIYPELLRDQRDWVIESVCRFFHG